MKCHLRGGISHYHRWPLYVQENKKPGLSTGLSMGMQARVLRDFLEFHELQCVGRAFRDTRRPETLIDPIHAVITLNDLSGLRVVLWDPPRAGTDTGHASDALHLVNEDDAVLTLLHSSGRADRHAERLFAVVAGAEMEHGLWHALYRNKGRVADLAEKGTDREPILGLAMELAGMTTDAALGVEEYGVFSHSSILLTRLRELLCTVTNFSQRQSPPPAGSIS